RPALKRLRVAPRAPPHSAVDSMQPQEDAMKTLASLMAAGALVATCLAPSSAAAQTRPDSTTARTDSSALDADAVIRRVLEQNPTIAAARSAWTESGARARQSGALEDPMLDFMVAPRSLG